MDEAEINRVKQYIIVIGRALLVLGAVFCLVLFSGIFVIDHVLPAPYSATAAVEIKPVVSTVAPHTSDENPSPLPAALNTIKSPHLLWPVIQKLGLEQSWKEQLPPAKDDREFSNEAITHLQEILKVDTKAGSNVLAITATGDRPQEAADIANNVAEQYKAERDREDTERLEHQEDVINDQIDRQQQVITAKKAGLDELRDSLEAKGIQIKADTGKQELSELQIYHAAQRDLERQKALLDAFTLHLRQVSDDAALTESSVRIVSRAEAPAPTSRPNRHFQMMVNLVVAILLSLGVASSVEVVFLLLRAAKRSDN